MVLVFKDDVPEVRCEHGSGFARPADGTLLIAHGKNDIQGVDYSRDVAQDCEEDVDAEV